MLERWHPLRHGFDIFEPWVLDVAGQPLGQGGYRFGSGFGGNGSTPEASARTCERLTSPSLPSVRIDPLTRNWNTFDPDTATCTRTPGMPIATA